MDVMSRMGQTTGRGARARGLRQREREMERNFLNASRSGTRPVFFGSETAKLRDEISRSDQSIGSKESDRLIC